MAAQCIRRASSIVMVGIGVLVPLLAVACDSTAPDASTRDEIVYHVLAGADGADLHAVSADGARSRQVTNVPGMELDPAVSRDGARIAFVGDREGNAEIYVVNADGSGEVRLTNDAASDVSPAWSPDGQRVVFASNRDAGEWELYTVRADGTGLTRVTTNTVLDLHPHWSPDGTKIVVSRDRDDDPGNLDLYVLNSDGTNPVRVTDARRQEYLPRWSPDGRRIAFIADTVVNFTGGGRVLQAIAIVDAGGSPRALLTAFSDAGIQGLTWSRDGGRIVFDQSEELWTVDVRTRSVTRVTNTPATAERAPSWRMVP